MRQAIDLFRPDVILTPFLKRAIPSYIWRQHVCLMVHPGPPDDRGPTALDWAILRGAAEWGVTVLQASSEMNAAPVWASTSFPMRSARKSSLYRYEITEGAVIAVRAALARIAAGSAPLLRAGEGSQHRPQPPLQQAQRAIDWSCDDTATVLRKIRSADGSPGVKDALFDRPVQIVRRPSGKASHRPTWNAPCPSSRRDLSGKP